MIFVDSWAWIALASEDDQYHEAARKQHRRLKKKLRKYVTTDYVLAEVITFLYRTMRPEAAQAYVDALLAAIDNGFHQLVHVTHDRFRRAWQMRRKYADKPDISFVDFTSMVVMQDLGITEVFTGDEHFEQVGPGFRMVP